MQLVENHDGNIYINALNIHQGGGLVLLKSLIKSFDSSRKYVLIVDSRCVLDKPPPIASVEIRRVRRSIIHRFFYEIWFWLTVNSQDIFLSFTNLPPIFRLKAKVLLFVQNRYLVEQKLVTQGRILLDLRVLIERKILKCFAKNADIYFVQTYSMRDLLINFIKSSSNVNVAPFLPAFEPLIKTARHNKPNTVTYDFLYVSSGELHKNHLTLFEAWQSLAKDGVYPSLCVTLNPKNSPELCALIDKLKLDGLNIHNVGFVGQKTINQLYDSSLAFIYPSKMESFGMPLLEAASRKLPILASELDFVRDLIDPAEVFDPNSSKSIARAIKRFLRLDMPKPKILNSDEFLHQLFSKIDIELKE